jgi:hypothetical protein
MTKRYLIVRGDSGDGEHVAAEVYQTDDRAAAKRFVLLARRSAQTYAEDVGSYPWHLYLRDTDDEAAFGDFEEALAAAEEETADRAAELAALAR